MLKSELIQEIVERSGLKKKDVRLVMDLFAEVMKEELLRGEKVIVPGIGTFETTEQEERIGKNPNTGEEIMIPKTRHPKFHASRSLRDALKGK